MTNLTPVQMAWIAQECGWPAQGKLRFKRGQQVVTVDEYYLGDELMAKVTKNDGGRFTLAGERVVMERFELMPRIQGTGGRKRFYMNERMKIPPEDIEWSDNYSQAIHAAMDKISGEALG